MTISVANLLDAYGLMDAEIKTLRQQVKIAKEALTEIGREQSAPTATEAADKFQNLARAALKLMDYP